MTRSPGYLALLLATTGLALQVGCFSDAGAPPAESSRWARRFVPYDETWRPLDQVPSAPQDSPKMVIWEVSGLQPGTEPSAQQRRAAEDLVRRAEQTARARGWYDFQKGLEDGFKLLFADRRHYANEAFIMDDHILDPERPEFLMYYGTPQGKQLAGLMFYTRSPREIGPQPGGPLTLWHYHVWSHKSCLLRGLLITGLPDEHGACERGIPTHRSPEMIHIWLVDHPLGPFSTSMYLEPLLMQDLLERREARWKAEAAEGRS